jgi:sugar lactone lactonase YvrE
MMSVRNWELILDEKCSLGECPVWDSRQKRIFWIDILSGMIHYYCQDKNEYKVFGLGQVLGSIALRKTGGLVAAIRGGFATIDVQKETTWMIRQVEYGLSDIRFNDGKCDPAGRFWAGTMSISNLSGLGSLYVLDTNYCVKKKIVGVSCSNGMAWSPDTKTFYYIDTPTRCVVAYQYDIHTGGIKGKRTVIKIPEGDGYPDGMTIDTEGMLWIAMWDGWKIARYNPYTGEKLHEILLPISRVTSCVFGGESLEDLYVTTAKTGLTDEELKTQPLAGSLFVVRNCGYKGMNAFEFDG